MNRLISLVNIVLVLGLVLAACGPTEVPGSGEQERAPVEEVPGSGQQEKAPAEEVPGSGQQEEAPVEEVPGLGEQEKAPEVPGSGQQTNVVHVSGEQEQTNKTWEGGATYLVTSTYTVPSGTALTIEKGATVEFELSTALVVGGKLVVEGERGQDRVEFEAAGVDAVGSWNGIQFSPGSEGDMQWCIVEHATTNIFIHGSSPTIKHCDIRNGQKGIEIRGNLEDDAPTQDGNAKPIIAYNWIHHNYWGLHFLAGAEGTVEHNLIYLNRKPPNVVFGTENGIHIWNWAEPVIRHNLIYGSEWGIEIGNGSTGTIAHNLFANSLKGIYYYDFDGEGTKVFLSTPTVKSNYFWQMSDCKICAPNELVEDRDGVLVFVIDETGFTTTLHSSQSNEISYTSGGNAPGDDPRFTNENGSPPDFRLQASSPAVGYGPADIQPPIYTYTITLHTGEVDGAGTDADVFITLYGTNGSSVEYELDNPNKNDREYGSKDTYRLSMEQDLGDLAKIRIRHDNSGDGPGWFLEKAVIQRLGTDRQWVFLCNGWLATDESDGKIDRVLRAN